MMRVSVHMLVDYLMAAADKSCCDWSSHLQVAALESSQDISAALAGADVVFVLVRGVVILSL